MEKAIKEAEMAYKKVVSDLKRLEIESCCLQVKKDSLFAHKADLENILDALKK